MKPFLKWPGGKRKLATTLLYKMPLHIESYCEPFAGGAALFFDIQPLPNPVLADTNLRLIRTLRAIQNDVESLIKRLSLFRNEEQSYYAERARCLATDSMGNIEVASLFIYLNKLCVNGIHRVNKANEFNVPYCKDNNRRFCDAVALRSCSTALKDVKIVHASFEKTLGAARRGDFAFCDPPYLPISATSSFTGYTKNGFGMADHVRLRDAILVATRRGVNVMLSNSSAPAVYELYQGSEFHLEEVEATRSIAAKASSRGKVKELLITNYAPELCTS
jgi:DNA adenine methylase